MLIMWLARTRWDLFSLSDSDEVIDDLKKPMFATAELLSWADRRCKQPAEPFLHFYLKAAIQCGNSHVTRGSVKVVFVLSGNLTFLLTGIIIRIGSLFLIYIGSVSPEFRP